MPNFIEHYQQAIDADVCEQLINTLNQDKQLYSARVQGRINPIDPSIKETYLKPDPALQPLLQQLTQAITSKLTEYCTKYYFTILAGSSLTVGHPVTGEMVKLTRENFEEVGIPQIGIMMQQLFRLGGYKLQRHETENAVSSFYQSDCYPQQHSDDSLHQILSFYIFLNDVEQGGETEFSYQSIQFQPRRGDMLVFPAYYTHAYRNHAPVSNNKYCLSSNIMFNRSEVLYRNPG